MTHVKDITSTPSEAYYTIDGKELTAADENWKRYTEERREVLQERNFSKQT